MNNKTKFKSLLKDTLIFSMGSFGSKIILFFLVPFYTTYLTTDEYGISNLVFTIAQFLIPILSLEVFDAVLRFGLSKSEKKEDVLCNALVVICFDLILCIIVYPLLGFYKAIRLWRVYLLVIFVLTVLNNTLMNYLKVCGKNKTFAIISLLQTLVLCITNIVLIAWLRYGIRGYLLSNIFALLISSIVAFICVDVFGAIKCGKIKLTLMKQMLVYSSPLVLNSISWWLISSSDKIMIEGMINSSELGVYTVSAKIPALINIIISVFQQAWGISTIKEIESTNDTNFFSETFSYYCAIVFTSCIFVLSGVNTFMGLYVRGGEEFCTASVYVPFLLVSAVYSAISTFYGSLYTGLKKTDKIMITTLISGVVNVIVNYVAIRTIGTMGAVIGTLVAYVLTAAIRMIDMNKYIKLNVNYKEFITNCIILFAFAGIVTKLNKDNILLSILFVCIIIVVNFKQFNKMFHLRKQDDNDN